MKTRTNYSLFLRFLNFFIIIYLLTAHITAMFEVFDTAGFALGSTPILFALMMLAAS